MEDIFNCLRDDETNTYSHCFQQFANMRALREHINSFSCSCFRATKGTVIPIAARLELRMHLRHQSYQGLILDQNLTAELASRCAYCNQQIGPRAISKHYNDQHPDLMQYSTVHKDRVRWAANFGSGKSTCPLRRTQTQKLESHACGVLFQLIIMAGQTMQPEHYPIMPLNKRPWTTAFSEYTNVNHPDLSARPKPPQPFNSDVQMTQAEVSKDRKPACLHKCPVCHIPFLTDQGLQHHVQHAHESSTNDPSASSSHVMPAGTKSMAKGRPSKGQTTDALTGVEIS